MSKFETTFADMQKKYPKGVFHVDEIPPYDVVSTGSLALDYALDIGGFPTRRIIELGGDPGVGKTTIMLNNVNNFLERYPSRGVVYMDSEFRLEEAWVKQFIKPEDWHRFVVLQPESAEEAVVMYRNWAKTDEVSQIVWDSVAGAASATSYTAVDKKGLAQKSFAGISGILSDFCKQASALSARHNICTVLVNQTRMDMDGYRRYKTTGGMAPEFHSSIRIQAKASSLAAADKNVWLKINGEDIRVGYEVTMKIVKSSVGKVGRVATYWFFNVPSELGFGIDHVEETSRLSTLTGVVEKKGGWHYHDVIPDGKILGAPAFSTFLKENPVALSQISTETMKRMQSGTVDMSQIVPTSKDPEASLNAEEEDAKPQFGSMSLRDLSNA